MKTQKKFIIEDLSHVGEVRRAINVIAVDFGFDETKCGQVSIVVSELATNIIKHAQRGEMICVQNDHSINIIALDRGPGLGNVSDCFVDGFSTQGTAGNGLGAIKRLSSRFDYFTQPDKGSVIFVAFDKETESRKSMKINCNGFSLPLKGEIVSGDQWTSCRENQGLTSPFKIMVADGLGHGLMAHEASRVAVEAFEASEHHSPLKDVELLHGSLRSTRGAAIAVAYLDYDKLILEFCGLGNIAGSLVTRSNMKKLISYNGTAGLQMRKIQSLTYPLEKESLLVMHSDGLSSQWNILDYPGLFLKEPLIIAGILYRDFCRGHDDVTVIVAKELE